MSLAQSVNIITHEQLHGLFKDAQGDRVRIVSIEPTREGSCRITFELRGRERSKTIRFNHLVSVTPPVQFFCAQLRKAAREAERDIVLMEHEASLKGTDG